MSDSSGAPWGVSRRQYPAHPVLAVSIAVFRRGEVLLASRTAPPHADLFTLPGGLVEAGETLEAAALRELREETGILARMVGFNQPVQHIVRDFHGRVERHYVILSFAGLWLDGEGRAGAEAGEIVWRAPENLFGLLLTPGLVPVIAGAKRIVDGAR
jgi:ADP-ribose pyrophosphatase YjhB (NUDIX family)